MFQVVAFKRNGARQTLSAIDEHAEHFIVHGLFKAQIVRQFMIAQGQPVCQCATDGIRQEKPRPSRLETRRINGQGQLRHDNGKNDGKDANVGSKERFNFGMFGQNLLAPLTVWFVIVQVNKRRGYS
jgi:hypothetical protein